MRPSVIKIGCAGLCWLLGTSVLKIDGFAHFSRSCGIHWWRDARAFRVSPFIMQKERRSSSPQWETRGRKFLSSASRTRWDAELNLFLFRYYGLSLESLRLLFGTRGVTHPGPEPRWSDYHIDLVERRKVPFAEPAGGCLDGVAPGWNTRRRNAGHDGVASHWGSVRDPGTLAGYSPESVHKSHWLVARDTAFSVS